jgi:hypothetical protein
MRPQLNQNCTQHATETYRERGSFTHSRPMKVSRHIYAPAALYLRERATEQEVRRAPRSVWKWWRKEKWCPCWEPNTCQSVTSLIHLYRLIIRYIMDINITDTDFSLWKSVWAACLWRSIHLCPQLINLSSISIRRTCEISGGKRTNTTSAT